MTEVYGELAGAFLNSQKSSNVTLFNSTFARFFSGEQDLVFASDSSLNFSHVWLSDYNVTWISATNSNISVTFSTVTNGGRLEADTDNQYLTTSGFLDCSDCGYVLLQNSSFSRLRGKNGGAISAVSSSVHVCTSAVVVYDCEFQSCVADSDGGIGRFVSVSLYLAFSRVISSSAVRGGGV